MASSNLPAVALLAAPLERAVEQLLALDPQRGALLAPLIGKHILLDFTWPPMRLHLVPTESGIQFHDDLRGSPDVTLSGTLLGFVRMKFSAAPQQALFGGDVRIEGDTTVARQFQYLLDHLDIDWEGKLAGQVGATVAGQAFGWLQAGRQWLADSLTAAQLDCGEYLQEESRELPAMEEASQLYRDIDDLRADTDRLEARIDRLGKLLESPPLPGFGSIDERESETR